MIERLEDVNVRGWYNLNVYFHVHSTYQVGYQRFAECRDVNGNTFFLEVTEELLENLSSTERYHSEEKLPLEGIISYMDNPQVIYKVFYKEDNNIKSISGRTLFMDKAFGRTILVSLPHAKDEDMGIRIIDNRNIVSLILSNKKYISDEESL
jgi:hypothetical protein